MHTRGDPGEAVLRPLRDSINRNMNVRTVAVRTDSEGRRIKRGSITGIIGGPPSQRGVSGLVVPSPVIPPVVPPITEPPITEPPITEPPVTAPTWEQIVQYGQVLPVHFHIRTQPNSMNSGVLGPFPGPVIVERVVVNYGLNVGGGTDVYSLLRVDFAEDRTLASLVFSGAGLPTGVVTDSYTLWPYVNWIDGVDAVAGVQKGWIHLRGSSTNDRWEWSEIGQYLPLQTCYVKVYWNAENAAAATLDVTVFLRSLAYANVLASSSGTLDVVPRIPFRELSRAEKRAIRRAYLG